MVTLMIAYNTHITVKSPMHLFALPILQPHRNRARIFISTDQTKLSREKTELRD